MTFDNEGVFPLSVFPNDIREFIVKAKESYGFPETYVGSAILHAVAVAIGNSRVVKFKDGMVFKPIIFMALVGDTGVSKSPPLRFVYEPLLTYNASLIDDYNHLRRQYDEAKRRAQRDNSVDIPEKPVCKQIIVSDITTESLICVHKANPVRLCLYSDELATWYSSFNRYRKSGSGDEQFWLSVHSGSPICFNRKTNDEVMSIAEPCISVIGTIQPGILVSNLSGRHQENGFLFRILQARIPDEESTKIHWNENVFPAELRKSWQDKILGILKRCDEEYSAFDSPSSYTYEEDAKQGIILWQNDTEDRLEREGRPEEVEIYRKIQVHVHKFALILHTLKEERSSVIGFETAIFATLLCDYYFWSAICTLTLMEESNPPTVKKRYNDLFFELDDKFTTQQAVEAGRRLGISERSVKYYLKDFKGRLFSQLHFGVYAKM